MQLCHQRVAQKVDQFGKLRTVTFPILCLVTPALPPLPNVPLSTENLLLATEKDVTDFLNGPDLIYQIHCPEALGNGICVWYSPLAAACFIPTAYKPEPVDFPVLPVAIIPLRSPDFPGISARLAFLTERRLANIFQQAVVFLHSTNESRKTEDLFLVDRELSYRFPVVTRGPRP